MLSRLSVRGFKSLESVELGLPKFALLFGPNAVGKSNFLDALEALSRLATERTVSDALAEPHLRGRPVEAFSLPTGGLPELYDKSRATFEFEADMVLAQESRENPISSRYRLGVDIQPAKATLSVGDEYLVQLGRNLEPKFLPRIDVDQDVLNVRRQDKGRPQTLPLHQNYTQLSDRRYSGKYYSLIEATREELRSWRTYYLDPRTAMRAAAAPQEVRDIGPRGEALGPFLYGLKLNDPSAFRDIVRTARTVIPSIQQVDVDLDTKRGEIDLFVEQYGRSFSARVISEGTLRVLGIAAIALNPDPASLVAFEEPENGVHPRRLDAIADLLVSTALHNGSQVVATSHSPRFAARILHAQQEHPDDVGVFTCSQSQGATMIRRFDDPGPLFESQAIQDALAGADEERLFEAMLVRGWLDG